MKFLADEDFLKNQPKDLLAVIFSFPKIPTSEIIPLIEIFLKGLKQELTKDKIFTFSKLGLETVS